MVITTALLTIEKNSETKFWELFENFLRTFTIFYRGTVNFRHMGMQVSRNVPISTGQSVRRSSLRLRQKKSPHNTLAPLWQQLPDHRHHIMSAVDPLGVNYMALKWRQMYLISLCFFSCASLFSHMIFYKFPSPWALGWAHFFAKFTMSKKHSIWLVSIWMVR